jgi:hypothetical protein
LNGPNYHVNRYLELASAMYYLYTYLIFVNGSNMKKSRNLIVFHVPPNV